MLNRLVLFLLMFMLLQDFTLSLRLVEVRIPNYVINGSTAQLECLYDLDGEALYSVKWYKDGNEFYRYVPRDMPPAQTFLLPGVSVDVHNSSDAIVTLREVNLQSAGRFRCEVSGEAPSFQTVTEHGDMVVVSLPDQGAPKIGGGRPRYQIGEWVRVNCTAGRSKPAVRLEWFVNGEAAESHMLRKYDTIISGREGLETSILGLQFRVEQHHFRNGDMKLKCIASLSTFYWRSNEESVEGDRPQKAPVLESRETVYASNSRADPVQATNKTDSSLRIKPATLLLIIAMALVTTTGCLEQLYLKEITKIKKQTLSCTTRVDVEKKQNNKNKSKYYLNSDWGKETKKCFPKNYAADNNDEDDNNAEQHQPEENLNEMHFNKEMASLSIIMATTNTTPLTLIRPLELTTLATSVSCGTSTSISSSKASSLSTRQQTKTLNSR